MSRRAVEQPLDAHPGLQPGQRPTRAAVHAPAEGEVLTCVVALDAELVRVRRSGAGSRLAAPLSTISVTPGRDVDAADGGRAPRQPEVALDRRLHPERLLDEVRE